MDVSQVTNSALQQIVSVLFPQGAASASTSQATKTSAQGIHGHHQHSSHRNMANLVSQMKSVIDNAVKAGKLTEDQASQMKKELDSIAQTLQQGQSDSGAQLTSDQLHQIRTDFQDVRKQLFDALTAQGATTSSNRVDSLFKRMDANGDGVVDKNELLTFINQTV